MSLTSYFKGVQAEAKHIKWPTTRMATILTIIVVILSILIAAYLGALDYIFSNIVQRIFI